MNKKLIQSKKFIKGNTKQIGNIGEIKTISKFVELGIPVYIPFGDNEKADLVAEFGGKLNKIQVKTTNSSVSSNDIASFDLTTQKHSGKEHYKYDSADADFFACYDAESDDAYLLPIKDQKRSGINIRKSIPKNHQVKNINNAEDFIIENVLAKIEKVDVIDVDDYKIID